MKHWNADKKHRCPGCHTVWVWGPKYIDWWDRKAKIKPRWWRVYECYRCGLRFAGWGRK